MTNLKITLIQKRIRKRKKKENICQISSQTGPVVVKNFNIIIAFSAKYALCKVLLNLARGGGVGKWRGKCKMVTIAQTMMIMDVGQFRSERLTRFISSGELEHYENSFLWRLGQHFANKGHNLSFKSLFSQSNFVSNVVISLKDYLSSNHSPCKNRKHFVQVSL